MKWAIWYIFLIEPMMSPSWKYCSRIAPIAFSEHLKFQIFPYHSFPTIDRWSSWRLTLYRYGAFLWDMIRTNIIKLESIHQREPPWTFQTIKDMTALPYSKKCIECTSFVHIAHFLINSCSINMRTHTWAWQSWFLIGINR